MLFAAGLSAACLPRQVPSSGMSRRTAPLYAGARAVCPEAPTPEPVCVFTALEAARFDNVRRAFAANPGCLQASHTPANPGGPAGMRSSVHITPVDYAVDLCRLWESMLAHCERASTLTAAPGYLNLRRRLSLMARILEWLVLQPGAPLPSASALHTVIACHFVQLARILVERAPALAVARDHRGCSPLHVALRLTRRAPAADMLEYVTMLCDAGARPDAQDREGCTPLHELVASLSESHRSWGLERTRQHRVSLRRLRGVVDVLIVEGADINARDREGCTPLDIAMRDGLEYLVLVRSADAVYQNVRKNHRSAVKLDTFVKSTSLGLFEDMPYEVVTKIFSHLSPRDAVTGIGTTCKVMRALATSELDWRKLSASTSLALARHSVRRQVRDVDAQSAP